MKPAYLWDYHIDAHWHPKSSNEWIWFLERKINYDDFKCLRISNIQKYFNHLKLDPGKRLLLEAFFKHYGKKKKI